MTQVQLIPVDKIRVINARSRNKAKFREITDNIATVGLKKPITVSKRDNSEGYDLVCGQGRLEAFQACGVKEIPAIVVDIPLEDRLLHSLVENLTRRTPGSFELVRSLLAMKDRGHSPEEIARTIGVSESYVHQVIRLFETGEQRLLVAVERGEIPITAAIEIATTEDAALQHSLQEAYSSGQLRGRALLKVRKIIEERRIYGKDLRGVRAKNSRSPSSTDLVRTLRRETQRQELLVKKSRHCEQQLRFVVTSLRTLLKNDRFVALLRAEKLDALPKVLSEMVQK